MIGPMWTRIVIATFTLAGAAVLLIAMAAPSPCQLQRSVVNGNAARRRSFGRRASRVVMPNPCAYQV